MAKRFRQGFYKVINQDKYIGDLSKVYYRSSWEYQFMIFLDLNNSVLQWSSETVVIPYISPKDNKPHRYYVDFYMKVYNSKGTTKEHLVEIKPVKDSQLDYSKNMSSPKAQQRLAESAITMTVNNAKWEAAKEFCKRKNIENNKTEQDGISFMVLTERELFGKN